jgi:hypothetical protein
MLSIRSRKPTGNGKEANDIRACGPPSNSSLRPSAANPSPCHFVPRRDAARGALGGTRDWAGMRHGLHAELFDGAAGMAILALRPSYLSHI